MERHALDFSLPHRKVPHGEEQFVTKLTLDPQGAQLAVTIAITRHLGETQSECTGTFLIALDQVLSDDRATLVRHIPLIVKGLHGLDAHKLARTLSATEVDHVEIRVTDVIRDIASFLRRQLPAEKNSGQEILRRATPHTLSQAEKAEAAK